MNTDDRARLLELIDQQKEFKEKAKKEVEKEEQETDFYNHIKMSSESLETINKNLVTIYRSVDLLGFLFFLVAFLLIVLGVIFLV
jgi:uncharacterized membrane protein